MTDLLNQLIEDVEVGAVAELDIVELRAVRDRCQETESGLSFGRRLVQGRLDIVMLETARRAEGSTTSTEQLLDRLPAVLARHTRGAGVPRPVRETDLPAFCDDLARLIDDVVAPGELADLAAVDEVRLAAVVDELQALERAISARRHELHRVIDELQAEIVARYRSGAASVDDLLR